MKADENGPTITATPKTENNGAGEAKTVFDKASPDQIAARKKADAQNRKDFVLHVSLIEAMEGLNVSAARAVAYREGPSGLAARLGKPTLV